MAEESAAVFWSYAREDDDYDGGRIVALAANLRAEYALLTGSALELFVDRDSIEWGDAWEARIDRAIAGTTFFIPVITPRYFTREACRRELLKFAAEARRLGIEELLLPAYYITVPELGEDVKPDDEAMALVKSYQWEDIRELRLADKDSGKYRAAVNRLAATIAKRATDITRTSGPTAPDGLESHGEGGRFGSPRRTRSIG